MALVEKARAAGHAERAALLNLSQASMSLGRWSRARASVDEAALRAEPEWLPAIHDLRQALAAKGVR